MNEKNGLPRPVPVADPPRPRWRRQTPRKARTFRLLALGCLCFIAFAQWQQLTRPAASVPPPTSGLTAHGLSLTRLEADLATCAQQRKKPQDPIGLGRERNARYFDGHAPTLIRNASVW
ncbi:hypothetical protein C8A05DRAFT_40166, partial [Staphylotrichum tortipilum]